MLSVSLIFYYRSHNCVGCIVALDGSNFKGISGRLRLGVVKFFLPKWSRFFIHMFSSEEGTTEFMSMPKAIKEVNSWLIKGKHAGVDMSRLEQERFWIGGTDLAKVTLMCEEVIWERGLESVTGSDMMRGSREWIECTECGYLIDREDKTLECIRCHSSYHGDCLFSYEKHAGRDYDPSSLDKEAKRYQLAARKWSMRKSSKAPSVVLVDDEIQALEESLQTSPEAQTAFTCQSCKNCRYCCAKITEEIIPSGSNLLPIEPFVICTKCNSAAHGHCVFPPVPKLHSSVQWVCDDCRECNSCGRITYLNENSGIPSPLTDWALPSFDQCKQCFAGLDKGEYCPVCMRAWSVDWGGDMVQCDVCEFWVHVGCDDLGSINLSKLGGADVKFNCPICRDASDVHRRRRVIDLLRTIDKVALFSEPVSAEFMPVYLKVIKQPMDLSKMSRKHYNNNFEFIKDFELIVSNAKIFNMPNSPAYRLAEQFHKQGKLLVEKYLLIDRKGANKIEGLAAESEDSQTAQSKRSASVQAEKTWRSQQVGREARKKVGYEQALEMIRRLNESGKIAPKSNSGMISPYKRKLSGSRTSSMVLSISPKSISATPSSILFESPCGPGADGNMHLSESQLESEAMKLFGFKSTHFLRNQFSLFPKNTKNDQMKSSHIYLNADFSRLLQSQKPLSAQDIAKDVRWCLYDACSRCGSFGEPWNFVECQDCGECYHWFCCGLVAPPADSTVSSAQNPLVGSMPHMQETFKFKCRSCSVCQHCHSHSKDAGDRDVPCCLCGRANHKSCVSSQAGNVKFRLNFSPETNVETVIEGTSICQSCVLSQAMNFFKASTCKACNCLINPNVASCYFRAMPEPGSAAPVSGRASPLVHCVACGDTWHSRCLPEFSDIGNTDIQGIYLCGVCSSGMALVASKFVKRKEDSQSHVSSSSSVEEALSQMGNALKSYRTEAYKEMQIELVLETLRNVGILQNQIHNLSGSSLVADLIDIFAASSSGPTPILHRGALSDQEKQWIEWGICNKDFIVGGATSELGRKKSLIEAPTIANATSVKFKRMEDEDLLLAKRLHSVFHLVKCILEEGGLTDIPLEGGSKDGLRNEGSPNLPSNLDRDFFFSGAESGSRLLQAWQSKYVAGGIGPGVSIKGGSGGVFSVPDQPFAVWEDRQCFLCSKHGDTLVEGCLLPLSTLGKWVHGECLAWSFPTGISTPTLVEWRHARPVPMTVDSLGIRSSLSFQESEILDLFRRTENVPCTVCGLGHASVFCQSCHLGAAFHFPCAVSVNKFSPVSDARVLMDSRCRMLTCGKCLYRHPENEKFFTSNFSLQLQGIKSSQSVLNDVWTNRHLTPVMVEQQSDRGDDSSFSGSLNPDVVFREGPLSIVSVGKFPESFTSFVYDGSSSIVPPGFVSVRLFWILDLTLAKRDEEAGVSITHNGKDLPQLKKRRRGAYLCRISDDGQLFSIQVIGGRVVAVGKSLSEVWTEFKTMIGVPLPVSLTGEWFFGLTCSYMRKVLGEIAIKSVKRQAGLHREKWLYQPQLREYVTEALGLKSELKTVTSIRRNLNSRIDSFKQKIDQLRSLGRKAPEQNGLTTDALLEPALVICEINSGTNDDQQTSASSASLSSTSKPIRAKTSLDIHAPTDSGLRYKIRNAIPDIFLLSVKRSKIHNYGLFAKNAFIKGDMVVEYQGEILRQTIADEREKKSEREGDGNGGSCYMFKLDDDYVVDATVKGNCARFINHSCAPNCSCKMIEDETRQKHIMIIAKRDILPGEEITYDYQFAVESEKLACLCGAPNCLGRLN